MTARRRVKRQEGAEMKRIGLLTSGGDCQGLNTALRGVAKALYEACDELETARFPGRYAA
jgi:6-phosphofructokinase 1